VTGKRQFSLGRVLIKKSFFVFYSFTSHLFFKNISTLYDEMLFYFLIITSILEIYTVNHVITIPISFLNRLDGQIVSTFFNLNHSDASSWKTYAFNFASDHGLNSSAMIETVHKKLENLKYPEEILSHTNLTQNFTFTSRDASNLLLENSHIFSKKKSEEKNTDDLTTKLYFYSSKQAADYFQSNIYVKL
jgi:hypothetical protein